MAAMDNGAILKLVRPRLGKYDPAFGNALPLEFNRKGLYLPDLAAIIADGAVR